MMSVTFDCLRASHNDTRDAIAIMHPDNPLQVVFLPRSEVIGMVKSGRHTQVEIPDWLAEEKGIS